MQMSVCSFGHTDPDMDSQSHSHMELGAWSCQWPQSIRRGLSSCEIQMSEGSKVHVLEAEQRKEEDRLSKLLSCYLHKFFLFLLQAHCALNGDSTERNHKRIPCNL